MQQQQQWGRRKVAHWLCSHKWRRKDGCTLLWRTNGHIEQRQQQQWANERRWICAVTSSDRNEGKKERETLCDAEMDAWSEKCTALQRCTLTPSNSTKQQTTSNDDDDDDEQSSGMDGKGEGRRRTTKQREKVAVNCNCSKTVQGWKLKMQNEMQKQRQNEHQMKGRIKWNRSNESSKWQTFSNRKSISEAVCACVNWCDWSCSCCHFHHFSQTLQHYKIKKLFKTATEIIKLKVCHHYHSCLCGFGQANSAQLSALNSRRNSSSSEWAEVLKQQQQQQSCYPRMKMKKICPCANRLQSKKGEHTTN